jgi:integrase
MNPSEIPLTDRIEALRLARDVSKGYIGQLGYSVANFSRWLKRPATIGDLHADTANRWLMHLGETGLSKYTIHTYWRHLRAIWYHAFDEGLTEAHPRRVRKIKKPRLANTAWNAAQLVRLLAEADKLVGVSKKSRVPRAAFWRAFLLVGYDTGLRRGDMLRLKTTDVRGRSEFTVVQHKTGWPVVVHLRPETVAAVEATYPPERDRVFSGYCQQKVITGLKALVKAAGIPPGGCHMLRRSSATALEMVCPGAATRHLGHLTPDLAMKHYLDHAQLDRAKPMPPALVEGGTP